MRNRVDLPHPEGTSSAMSYPAATSASTTSFEGQEIPKAMADGSRRKSCPRESLETPNCADIDLIILLGVDANSAGTGSGPDNNGHVLSPRVDDSDAGNLNESL